MKEPGLVWVNGEFRLAGYAEEAIAEAIDEAVEFIIDLVEDRGAGGMTNGVVVTTDIVGAVDERLRYADRRIEGLGKGASVGGGTTCVQGRLGERRELLVQLRSRAAALGE